MKVLLVNPPGTDKRQIWPPLGLMSVSAMLRRLGHTTRILDMLALRSTNADLEEHIRSFGPDLVGTGYTTPQNDYASGVIKTVKKLGHRIIIGGPHPTALPEESLKETGADAAYLWEIEHTIGQSLEQVAAGELSPGMPGVAYLRDGTCVTGPAGTPLQDLDELPFLDYSEIPFEIYSTRQQTVRFPRRRPMATLVSSRGCPHRCSFCMNFMGKRWRSKSAGRVLEEIDILVKNFGVREIWILDDNFTFSKPRVLDICESIRRRNYRLAIRFPNGVRADRVDDEMLAALKGAGVYNIAFGIESGNQQILDRLGKGERLESVLQAIRLANARGILTSGFFVLGLPGDTEATVRDSIEFAVKSGLSDVSFFVATPYPGTRLWDEVKDRLPSNWTDFDQDAYIPVSCTEHITPARLLELVRIANRRFYFRPKIIMHIARYLLNVRSLGIFKNKLLSYLGLRSGNI